MAKRIVMLVVLLAAAPAAAYVSVDADADVALETRISRLSADQQLGTERVECAAESGAVYVRVIRIAKTVVSAESEAYAKARCEASARYSDSCSCSGCSGSCHTSGSGSDSDSRTSERTARDSKTEETRFAVARVSLDSLSKKGFSANPGESGACAITGPDGSALDPLKAIATVTWIYGEELMKDTGAEALYRLSPVHRLKLPRTGFMINKVRPRLWLAICSGTRVVVIPQPKRTSGCRACCGTRTPPWACAPRGWASSPKKAKAKNIFLLARLKHHLFEAVHSRMF